MIGNIFLAEIIPRGWLVFYASHSSILPLPENKHVSHVGEEIESEKREEDRRSKEPKKRITLASLVAPQGSLLTRPSIPMSPLFAFSTQMLSLCIRLGSISFRRCLPLDSDFADGAKRHVRWNTNSGSQIYRFLISQAAL